MGERKKKLLLINPISPSNRGFVVNQGQRYPPLGLGIVAALTPPHWEVEILDEVFTPYDYVSDFRTADLVAFTSFTFSANRAYEIAAQYRSKNIPVVMGGVHASMVPEEAVRFMDVVVTGEAESVWHEVIADFEQGCLKPLYNGTLVDAATIPQPRNDLFHPGYWFASVQTTRGCPMNCAFCSVTTFNGNRHRLRPVNEVLDEIASVKKKMIFFVDDNIIGYGKEARDHALAIFRGMAERKLDKVWFSQASLNFADDPEILKAASDAGCRMILLGIESEKAEQLKLANKHFNARRLDSYYDIIRKIHRHNISVLGTFIFGLEGDTRQSLKERAQYILRSDIDAYQPSILTPLPGTAMYEKFRMEGRLMKTDYPADWDEYQLTKVVFFPHRMRHDELTEDMNRIWFNLYKKKVLIRKALKTFWQLRSLNIRKWFGRGLEATLFAYYTNWHFRNVALGKKEKRK